MGYSRFDSRNCINCKYFNDPVNFTIPEILDSCKHPEHFVPRAIIYNKENNFQFCDDHVFKYKKRKASK